MPLVGADVFPHDFVFCRHFKNAAIRTFANKRIAIGQALGRADEGAVKTAGVQRHEEACFVRRVLPHNLAGHGVYFEHAGVVALGSLDALGRAGIGVAVAAPAPLSYTRILPSPGRPRGIMCAWC